MRPARALVAATTLFVALSGAVWADGQAGRVVDTDRKPIAGARVCYMLGEAEGICIATDEQGRFDLPASHMTSYRVEASGFQPRMLKTGDREGPIVLERAAALWVRVRDASTGRTVPSSEVFLIMPDGSREGPLPANDKGVKIRTLVPGKYGVVARTDGYTQAAAVSVTLKPGDESWIDVEMNPVRQPRTKGS